MMGPYMMGGFAGGAGIFWMIFNLIFFLLIITGVVLLIIWLVRKTSASGSAEIKKDSALEILKTRYARGEISKKEYDDMKKDLS
jgi:putative membrane protein